jgi:archaellum component FlaC
MENRVTKLETRMEQVEKDISDIKDHLEEVAKKADIDTLRSEIERRDKNYTNNLWKLVFGLTGLVALLAGVTQLAKIFMPVA